MPTCEVCGHETRSTREVILEGAKLQVCSRCAKLGQPIRGPKPPLSAPRSRSTAPSSLRRSHPSPRYRETTRPRRAQRELVAVEDFANLIRTAREQRGMSQKEVARSINERTSVITKLESGKMAPTIALARKLERLFKLTLLEEAESLDLSTGTYSSATTLGDVVEIRRKKPSS